MKVRDVMRCPVRSVPSTESIADAAALMVDCDVGVLPVVDKGRLVGIVTDRDLAVRGLAAGLDGRSAVLRLMTGEVTTCHPDDQLGDVLKTMAQQRIRRVPVRATGGELVGMISIGDAAENEEYAGEAAATLADICRPHGRHCQASGEAESALATIGDDGLS